MNGTKGKTNKQRKKKKKKKKSVRLVERMRSALSAGLTSAHRATPAAVYEGWPVSWLCLLERDGCAERGGQHDLNLI
jgi:hypothetical protein